MLLGKPPDNQSDAPVDNVFRQLRSLLSALRTSPLRWIITWLAVGIVAVILVNMVGQVRLNAWQGDFYDALEQRHLQALLQQVLVFLMIVAGLLGLVVGETWLREMLEVRAREWLTHDLINQWLIPRRAYLLAYAGDIGVNPDQRMQADALRLTELSIGLSIGLLRSSLSLLSFLGVLWMLSGEVMFTIGERTLPIPGYLVWCALAYAISGSWLTWRVGRPLIAINAERYAREAELRFALVRISESAEAISVYGGETDERRGLETPVDRVVAVTRRLANRLARLTWITSGYGWLGLVVPVLVAAPGYFQGALTFGGLMMAVGAFNHVQAALGWFVDNFPAIANWRATLFRVVAFRDALPALEALGAEAGRIRFVEHTSRTIVFQGLTATMAEGQVALSEARLEVAPGDRVLIAGEAGAGKSVLFRAIAGLWPWGHGTVHLPAGSALMFVPHRPYLPLGTLRVAVTYPATPESFDDAAVHAALSRLGLDHLASSLDREERWDKELSLEEQCRLAFARILLHAPQGVFLDGTLGSLDDENRRLVLSIFEHELADTTVVSIGGPDPGRFYDRTLHTVYLPRAEARGDRAAPHLVPVSEVFVARPTLTAAHPAVSHHAARPARAAGGLG